MRDGRRRAGHLSRFPVALRRTGVRFLGILFPPRDSASLTVGLPATPRRPDLTGFPRSACASSDRGGRPLDPEASGVHTTGENCPAAACRSSTARPCTPVFIPSAGALGNEASAGVHSRSPVRSSPRLRSRMERERFGFFPELRTPQLPATHVRAGTGPGVPRTFRTADPYRIFTGKDGIKCQGNTGSSLLSSVMRQPGWS